MSEDISADNVISVDLNHIPDDLNSHVVETIKEKLGELLPEVEREGGKILIGENEEETTEVSVEGVSDELKEKVETALMSAKTKDTD